MRYLFGIGLVLVSGLACMIIAKKRGKDPAMWFAAGIVFNVFALAAIAFGAKAIQKKRMEADDE